MKQANLQLLAALGCNLLMLFLLFSWNEYWTRHGVYFHLPGLFFLFGAIRLDDRRAIGLATLTGLLIDSATPAPLGLHAFGLVLCHLVSKETGKGMLSLRGVRPIINQQAGNLFLLTLLTAWSIGTAFAEKITPDYARIAGDVLLSHLLLIPIGIWFLAFQEKIMLFLSPETMEQALGDE